MRFRHPVLITDPMTTHDIECQLLDSLFGQSTSLIIGGMTMEFVAILVWAKTGSLWMIVWGAAGLISMLGRLALGRLYAKIRAEGGRPDSPTVWAWRFMIGAWIAALTWGLSGLFVLTTTDPFVRFLVLSSLGSLVAGGAARNNASPAAAGGQTILMLFPVTVSCSLSGDPFYQSFAFLNFLNMLSTLSTIKFLGERSIRNLIANAGLATANRDLAEIGANNVNLLEEIRRMNQQLQDSNVVLADQVITDAMTGLTNRRGFDIAVLREWRQMARTNSEFSLLMIDVDHFKSYNDFYGHPAGDRCLRVVASALAAAARRPSDIVTRYGGEEFAVILPETNVFGAEVVAEAIRKAVAECQIPHFGADYQSSPDRVVTISIGIASTLPDVQSAPDAFISHADSSLYQAKKAGRNCFRSQIFVPQNSTRKVA